MFDSTLLNAILALDAYNRGYGEGVYGLSSALGTKIGSLSILQDDVTHEASGFYAIAYRGADGQTIISYRGTNADTAGEFWKDASNGYLIGAGLPLGSQGEQAIKFYKDVLTNGSDAQKLSVTGHSLGGGLAGYVAGLYGKSGVLFDNMTFNNGVVNAYQVAMVSYLPPFDLLTEATRKLIYGDQTPWAYDFSKLSAYAVTGELLAEALPLRGLQTPSINFIDSFGGLRSPLDLHSQALQTILLWANASPNGNVNSAGAWHSVGSALLDSLFDDRLGLALGLLKGGTGTAGEADQLMRMIAYSALYNPGEQNWGLVFGDTAIRALFDDADMLGVLNDKSGIAAYLKDSGVQKALAEIAVEYAGLLAVNKTTHDQDTTGEVGFQKGALHYDGDKNQLVGDFSRTLWTKNGAPVDVLGKKDLTTAAAQFGGVDAAPTEMAVSKLWNGNTDQLVKLVAATADDGADLKAVEDGKIGQEGALPTDGAMLVGGGGSNHLYGASGNDLLVGGKGNDTLDGKGGSDLLFGGADNDTFVLGYGGTDWVDGGSGSDTARFDQSEHSHTVLVSSANGKTPNGDGIFVVRDNSTQGIDYLTSVEHINLTGANNTLIVKQFDPRGISVAVTVDLGSAANDTADFTQYGGPVYLNSGGEGSLALYSDPNFGVRTGLQVKGASTILLTNGDDRIKGTGPGTIVHTGKGHDQIEASHNGQLLIEDASTDDRITFYGTMLTGGVQWAIGSTETTYAWGSHGERYGRNAQGDLIIKDWFGNETFIPDFNFSTAGTNLTAGLYVIQVQVKFERSNGWTAAFETAASQLTAMKKIKQALTGIQPSGTDPLVLDLSGDGVINVSSMAGNNASFDVDKDGFAERVGWVRGGDGMLVRDLSGNGKIDDIGEMFGNDQTSGFTQLASLDGNHDGKISAEDNGLADFNGDGVVDATDTFSTLKIWVDANEDGKTDAGELKSLASLDIVSISTGSTATNTTDSGNTIAATGTFTRGDGTTGAVGEVHFDTDNTHTTWLGNSSVSADAASRPDLKGFGTLTDLHVAMTLDSGLVQIVDGALPSLNTLSLASLRDAARTILYAWAGAVPVPAGTPGTEATQDFWFVGDVTRTGGVACDFLVKKGMWVPPNTDPIPYYGYASGQNVYNADKSVHYWNPTIDMVLASPPAQGSWNKLTAQDVAFLERYTGLDLGFVISENPSQDAIQVVADGLTASWNTLNRLAVRLAAQGPLAPFFAGVTYDVATDKFLPTTEHQLVPMLEAIFHATPTTASAAQDYLAQWHDIINVVLPDFQRDNQGHQLTDAFLFQNLVGAYEDVPLAISLQQAAAIFDIPASEIKTGTGTLVGDDSKTDLFYLDSSNQVLQGQGGSDAYIVGNNFGHDVIQDVWQGLGQNQEDSIWFSHLNASDLTFTRDGLDLLITQNGTSNQIRVVDEFAGRRPGLVTAFQDFDKQIEIIKFADGTTWDQLDIAKAIGMPSYATDDNLMGTPDVDFLNGGAGTDYMSGGDAGDHYFFGRGDGQDTIEDREVWIWQAAADYVHFGAGITEDDVTFQRVGVSDDLQVGINGTNDDLTVTDQFGVGYGLLNTYQDRIEYFTFADGSYIGWEDIIKALDAAAGTSANDTITGFSYDDVLDGGTGNDFLTGGNGNDTYVFGRGYGSDTIEDRVNYILSGTDDTVKFNEGITQSDLTFHHDGNTSDLRITINGTDDSLKIIGEFSIVYGLIATMDDRIESFTFADGTVLGWHDILQQIDASAGTAGNDTIYGFGYDDILQGGAGDDYLAGGQGNDTYVYSRGDGNDTIYDLADAQGPEFDTLVLHGINPADVSFSRINNTDVALIFAESAPGAGDAGSVLLQGELDNWFAQGVEQINFDDGTVWTQSDLRVKVLAAASTPGNDTIVGFNTNDIIEGGHGDDTISGGAGDDTYIYTRGDGNDSITEVFLGNYSSFDTLRLHAIDPASVRLVRNGDDVTFQIAESTPGAGDGGSILLKDELNGGLAAGVEQVVFDDGTVWNQVQMRVRVLADAATDGNDIINGFQTNDTLRGGKGDDTLYGWQGDDTYVYARGDGHDVVYEVGLGNYSSFDTLRLQNIAPTAIQLVRNQNDLTLVIAESAPGAGDGGSVLLKDELSGGLAAGVEQIVFDDGTTWTQANLRALWLAQEALTTDASIYGFSGDDTIAAGAVDRSLHGGGGHDTYVYSSSGGNVVIDDPGHVQSALELTDIASTDVSLLRPVANSGANLVITVNATGKTVTVLNEFTSSGGLRAISFSDGVIWNPDQIKAILAGGSGDLYVFNRGDGAVTVDQTVSSVRLGAGITADDVILQANGRDLIVKLRGGADRLTVYNALTSNTWGVSSTLSSLKFNDGTSLALGQPSAGHGLPLTFTWSLNTVNFDMVGSAFGTNVYEVSAGGKLTFADVSAVGGTNIVKFDKGAQNLIVESHRFSGSIELGPQISAQDVYWQTDSWGHLYLKLRGDSADSITIWNDLQLAGGTVTSAIKSVRFADGSVLDTSHGPAAFTWLGNTANFNITGSNLGTNVFEVTVAGKVNFADALAAGGTNIVKYDKGAQNLNVQANGFAGELDLGPQILAQNVYWQTNGYGDLILRIRGDATDSVNFWGDLHLVNGVVTSAIKTVRFADGSVLDTSHGPAAFTWLGNTANFDVTGSNLGTNVFEVTAAGKINFADASASGGTNIVKYDKGAQALNVQANGFAGELDLGPQILAQDVYWQTNGYGDLILRIRGDATDSVNFWGDLHLVNGVVTSAIKTVKFADGSFLDTSHGPAAFTWVGNTTNFDVTGSNLGTNVFEVTAAGKINFANASASGGTNIVKYDKGAQALNVQVNGFAGELDLGAQILAQDVYWQTNNYGDLILRIRGDATDSVNFWGDLHLVNGVVTSAIKTVKFSDGTALDMSHGPTAFTWIGATTGFDVGGTSLGTNIYEAKTAGKFTFANSSGVGGTNIVKYDRGAQYVHVQANNISGSIELGPQISLQDVYWQTNQYNDLLLRIRGSDNDTLNIWGDLQAVNGTLNSAIKSVKFSDGYTIDMSHGPSTFTWMGTAGSSISGTNLGANTFELNSGSETFTGGNNGNNRYIASASTGQAVIYPNEKAGTFNELDFVGNVTNENLWFLRAGNDLVVDILGTTSNVTIKGWFSSSTNQLQEIEAGGFKIDSQISQLVQAMASYSANHAGFDPSSSTIHTLPSDTVLQNAVAAAWHA